MASIRLKGTAHLRELWGRDEPAFGLWRMLSDPITAELCAATDFDYSVLDLQHGFGSFGDLPVTLQAARAAGHQPLVRTPWRDEWMIMRAIDAGAAGVIVPMINSRREAATAVAACKFPPAGVRSWGPMWGDVREDAAPVPNMANERVACIIMVETQQAVEQLEEIVQVPGIDAIYIGPNDLALACGFGRDTYADNPEVDELIQGIVDTCVEAGIPAGVHCSSVEMALDWAERGTLMLRPRPTPPCLRTAPLPFWRACGSSVRGPDAIKFLSLESAHGKGERPGAEAQIFRCSYCDRRIYRWRGPD